MISLAVLVGPLFVHRCITLCAQSTVTGDSLSARSITVAATHRAMIDLPYRFRYVSNVRTIAVLDISRAAILARLIICALYSRLQSPLNVFLDSLSKFRSNRILVFTPDFISHNQSHTPSRQRSSRPGWFPGAARPPAAGAGRAGWCSGRYAGGMYRPFPRKNARKAAAVAWGQNCR